MESFNLVLYITENSRNTFFIRVQISNADLVLKNGDKEQALAILRQITPEQRYVYSANICWVPEAFDDNGTIWHLSLERARDGG